ncbi:3545_t:CDS:10, partial [Cetraspora pellucida]
SSRSAFLKDKKKEFTMGVPALFRWLSKKYPKIIEKVVEELPVEINGVEIPVDISKSNPNNLEFDNLYLDMNGIIHPCCHPECKPAPETEDDMMIEIFKYTERIIAIVRPRKVLYLAIDGVAPRAKMNQQRSRRFRTAQEDKIKNEEKSKEIERLKESGAQIDEELIQKKSFDSNCITPGTPFMANLAKCLRYWIAEKLNYDPGWKNLKVILSDSNVPGEGEHKIMDFIRGQRSSPYHDPNTRHVIYGLDADLIMLSLSTHEPHFKVLREDVFFNDGSFKGCFICGRMDHIANQCRADLVTRPKSNDKGKNADYNKPYVLLNIETLREYLEIELKISCMPWPFNLENAIDDWVFLCFFVGNDFLPHLPSLEIREGAIDTLISIWKRCLPLMNGYITNCGNANLKRMQYLVTELGKMEDEIFIRRHRDQQRRTSQPAPKRRRINDKYSPTGVYPASGLDHLPVGMPLLPVKGLDSQIRARTNQEIVSNRQALRMANLSAAQLLKAELSGLEPPVHTATSDAMPTENLMSTSYEDTVLSSNSAGIKRKSEFLDDNTQETHVDIKDKIEESGESGQVDPSDDAEQEDTIRLWEPGFKKRYYKDKFEIELPNEQFRSKAFRLGSGEPFKPFEQLMGVLPAGSKKHLPVPFQKLMTSQESEIIDFYPSNFTIDLNGKKYAWQGVVLLPFIEEERLLKAAESIYPELADDEKERNKLGSEILCFSNKHKLYDALCVLYSKRKSEKPIPLDPMISDKLVGFVSRDKNCIPESTFYTPLPDKNTHDIVNDRSLSVVYYLPAKTSNQMHKSVLLRNVKLDPPRWPFVPGCPCTS